MFLSQLTCTQRDPLWISSLVQTCIRPHKSLYGLQLQSDLSLFYMLLFFFSFSLFQPVLTHTTRCTWIPKQLTHALTHGDADEKQAEHMEAKVSPECFKTETVFLFLGWVLPVGKHTSLNSPLHILHLWTYWHLFRKSESSTSFADKPSVKLWIL